MRQERSGFLLATLVLGFIFVEGFPAHASLSKRVSGNLVFWDQSRGFDVIRANADLFSEISPFWYRVEADGNVTPYTTDGGATYEDSSILSFLRADGILVIPTVANILNGVWDGALVSRIIADPALTALNIGSLVQLAITHGYDGIDLDYENLSASDRLAFTSFVNQLAAALHANGKLLTVNVYAKTSEPGTWSGPQAQDWWAIGQVVDQVRIMTYEYHWSTSGAGPISPVDWVGDVLAFARATIPAQKIIQGVPLYGYDWVGQSGVDLVWEQTMALVQQYGAIVQWDATSASPWFEYVAQRTRHTVWFENAPSVDAKLQVNVAQDVGGVSFWRLGGQDPEVWSTLRTRFGGTGPPPDSDAPSVSIISPANGGSLLKKQRIEALASDNIGVSRVEFYINDALFATDTSAPYVVYWNTRRTAPGAYVIKAVAYDPNGNSAAATVTAIR
jgi:spore germination protein YaaH